MKKIFQLLPVLILALTAAGCAAEPAPADDAAQEKTAVSMMYPLNLEHFESLAEKTFPDIDLQVELTTTATLNGDSERRLRNGHGTDLVVTTLPTGDVRNYVLDLSAEEFAGKYQATAMSPIRINGQARYLPLPGQYSGYVLNKTLMEQLGLTLPASNEELLSLFAAGRNQGVGIGEDGAMFGLEMVDPAAVGSYLIGTQVPDFLGGMDGIEWMAAFEAGNTGFCGVWDNCLEMPLACVENGYLNASALQLTKSNATPVKSRMLDGTLLLSYGNIRLLNLLNEQSEQYEYDMLPFLSDSGKKSWAISAPDAYIAVNNALSEETDAAVLDACRRLLGLLSSQEGQEAWIADTSATTSYLAGNRPAGEIPAGLAECVAGGYVYNLQMPSNVIQYFGRKMVSVLGGKLEMTEALAEVDEYCRNGSADVDYDQSVVGSVAEDLIYENYNTRLKETAIGNLVADAAAEYVGADIAVVNGGGIRASLYAGDVLGADLSVVCPYDNKLLLVETDGATIRAMLENGISLTRQEEDVPPSGRFLQVSGLRYSYRPMTEDKPAELLSVTLADGSPLDPAGSYTLAVIDYMAGSSGYLDNNGDGYTMLNLYSDTSPKAEAVRLLKETDASYADALRAYFERRRETTVSARPEGRITVLEGDN